MTKDEILLAQLKEYLSYNPKTGIFTWIKSRKGTRLNKISGNLNIYGYIDIMFNAKHYQGHRLAWFMYYGVWPINKIDHKDGIKDNNAILNLREATTSENSQNQKTRNRKSKVGLLGVRPSPLSKRNPYVAIIGINRKQIYLGAFPTAELAHQVYLNKKRELHPFSTI